MRYTHNIKLLRKRKHTFKISLIFSLLLLALILFLGFSTLDATLFFGGFVESLIRVCISYVISLAMSAALVLIVTSSTRIEAITLPILDVLQSFPSFAFYPLFVLWFGKTALVTVLILIAEMVWPLLFTLITARKQIHGEILEAAKIYGATGAKFLFFILTPLLLPALVTGSLIAWGEAWEAVIAAEIVVDVPGVGSYLALAGQHNQTHILIIGILLLLLILFLINKYLWLTLLNASTKYQE